MEHDQAARLSHLARHWMRQAELDRGIRIEAGDLALLNAIGIGELLASAAAAAQREAAQAKMAGRGQASQ